MPEQQPLESEQYQERMEKALRSPFLADRLDELAAVGTAIEERLKKYETAKKRFTANAAGIGLMLATIAGVLLVPALVPASIAPLGLALSMASGVFAGDFFGKQVYKETHGSEIAALGSLKDSIETEKEKQMDMFASLPLEEKAGIAKYDDLIAKHPKIASILARAFRDSVAVPVYEQGKAGKPGQNGSGRHHYARVPTAY